MRLGVDCSIPPNDEELLWLRDNRVDRIAGYIGGDTPYVWTPDDWQRCRIAGLATLPVYVAPPTSIGRDGGVAAGNNALSAMQASGLTSICCLDVEAGYQVTAEWAQGFCDALAQGQCDLMLYGKATEIDGLVDRLCTWVALPALPGDYLYDTAGVQYSWDSRYDWSYWDDEAPSA